MIETKMRRRSAIKRIFTILTSIFGVSYLAKGCGQETYEEYYPPFFNPETEEERTMTALADTIVPGKDSDPDGSPGAIEAGALIVLYDRYYPAYDYITPISRLLNSSAFTKYGKNYYELELGEREVVLSEVEEGFPPLSLLIKFIKASFYDALINDVGYKYLEYPGPNLGYKDDGFSFGKKMSEEMTDDGSLP